MSSSELPFETRPQTSEVLNFAKESLNVIKDIVDRKNQKKVSDALKQLSKWASAAPFVGPLFSLVNMVLVFLPQHDPVFEEVKKGFAEVNRKLDSLSIQISNLATDVEWFNYASVYSQYEACILNAWRRYSEVPNLQWYNNTTYLAKVFTNFYEYAQVEASVENIYNFLTVKGTSLSGNLNDLLKKKFKCDIRKITDYNQHFNQLLWKGKALSNIYWKLMGFDMSKNDYASVFRNVHKVQSETVDYCLNNFMQYVRDDVMEIAKRFSPEEKQVIANEAKRFLDDKYSWYEWVVAVYEKSDEGEKIRPGNIIEIPIDSTNIVAVKYIPEDIRKVSYGKTGTPTIHDERKEAILQCQMDPNPIKCLNSTQTIQIVSGGHTFDFNYRDNLIILFTSKTKKVAIAANHVHLRRVPYHTNYAYIHFLYVNASVCDKKCEKHGQCKRLLNSNEGLCVCKDGYYGENCEEKLKEMNITLTLSFALEPTDVRLRNIETKLNDIIKRLQG